MLVYEKGPPTALWENTIHTLLPAAVCPPHESRLPVPLALPVILRRRARSTTASDKKLSVPFDQTRGQSAAAPAQRAFPSSATTSRVRKSCNGLLFQSRENSNLASSCSCRLPRPPGLATLKPERRQPFSANPAERASLSHWCDLENFQPTLLRTVCCQTSAATTTARTSPPCLKCPLEQSRWCRTAP